MSAKRSHIDRGSDYITQKLDQKKDEDLQQSDNEEDFARNLDISSGDEHGQEPARTRPQSAEKTSEKAGIAKGCPFFLFRTSLVIVSI